MPACAAISGTSEVSVMPGCVLTSRQARPLNPLRSVVPAEIRAAHASASEGVMRRKR